MPSASPSDINNAYSFAEVASAGLLLKSPVVLYQELMWTPYGIAKSPPLFTQLARTPAAIGEAGGAAWDAWSPVISGNKK